MARKSVALAVILVASVLVLSCGRVTEVLDRIGTGEVDKVGKSTPTTAPTSPKGKPQILEFYADW